MYTLCSTEKTAQQQQKFEQTFLQMLLEGHYDEITISDLCRRAGLTRKMFYRLFGKKSDVLFSLIDHTLLEASQFVPDESVGPGELHRFFAYWRSQSDLLDALLKHQNSSLLSDRAVRFALNEDTTMVHAFGADENRFGYEMVVFYITGIFSLVLTWHSHGYNHSIDEMAQLMMDILMNPVIKHSI